MKKALLKTAAVASVAAILCFFAAACRSKEPSNATGRTGHSSRAAEERRVEPRLTETAIWRPCKSGLSPGHVVEEAECGPHISTARASIRSNEECLDMTSDHEHAVRTLATVPDCTDAAVERLELLNKPPGDARVLSDLAAAYYVHAQRRDRPSDLLRSLDAARRAVAVSSLPEARFNEALAEEALGLSAEASVSWDDIRRTDRSKWGAEAGERWNRMEKEKALGAAMLWSLSRRRIPEAVQAGDRAAVAQMIAPFPAAAQRYVEEEILPDWARALDQHDEPRAHRYLAAAEVIAAELARITGDPYLRDDVALIMRSLEDPDAGSNLKALIRGHLAFGQARARERAHGVREAADLYKSAERWLATAGSPLRGGAGLGLAIALSFEKNGPERARGLVDPIGLEARRHGYGNLLGRVQSNSANFLQAQGRYLESLAQYEAALAGFEHMGDRENMANMLTRRVGLFRTLGDKELAWREAFHARRYLLNVVEPQSRHHLLGEAAASALALGFPAIALLYQNSAVRLIQDALANLPPEGSESAVKGLRDNLAIAMRARAGIEVNLGQHEQAQRDVAEAIRLSSKAQQPDENIRRLLLARALEVKGQAVQASQPDLAVAAFTDALSLTTAGQYRTFRATLLEQRALAQRGAGNESGAESDLNAAVDELRAEEKELLAHPRLGGEPVLAAYFQRSREAYQRLIRIAADDNRPLEALAYAERARAFEPMNLVLQLDAVPEDFKTLASTEELRRIERIRAILPHATFLIEYLVLEDRTFVWIVSRERFQLLTQPVGEKAIDAWSTNLRRLARLNQVDAFDDALFAPYAALVEAAVAAVEKMPGGAEASRRLVFIPDASIHGLPLAALRNRRTGRYLIQDVPVSIAASATLYAFSLMRDEALRSSSNTSLLVIADPAFNEHLDPTRGLKRLPEAGDEASRIAGYYPGAIPLRGAQATVPRLFELAGGSAVVHFAGHAVSNPETPVHSFLVLAPSSNHSGVLEAAELVGKLRLTKTRLFVLAACSSAGGVPIGSEGLGPLVRPILAAGAPAVAGSLWNVSSSTTAELFVKMHKHYSEGADADRALQLAQLDLMHSRNAALHSVLAWAPFQVVGYASSPFSSGVNNSRRSSQ